MSARRAVLAAAITVGLLAVPTAASAQTADLPATSPDDVQVTIPTPVPAGQSSETTTPAKPPAKPAADADVDDDPSLLTLEAGLVGRYRSLSANLLSHWAAGDGKDVAAFTGTNQDRVTTLLGVQPAMFERFQATTATLGGDLDPKSLNERFAASGLLPDWASSSNDLGSIVSQMSTSSNLDAMVVNQSASWAHKLAALRAPELAAPASTAGLSASAGMEGLVFGLLADRSYAALVADHPSVFDQVMASGMGSPAHADAWRRSMAAAGAELSGDLEGRLLNPCLNSMLSVAATGDPAKSRAGCGGCAAGGLYLNSVFSDVFNPTAIGGGPRVADGVTTRSDLNATDSWLRDFVLEVNPQLGPKGTQTAAKASVDCAASSAAAEGTLRSSLPSIFSSLKPVGG